LSTSLRAKPAVQLLVSVLVFGGLFAERYFFVVGGQVIPLFKGTWEWELIQYTPSVTEWSLAIMGSAMLFALYALGEKMLGLSATPEPSAIKASAGESDTATAAAGS